MRGSYLSFLLLICLSAAADALPETAAQNAQRINPWELPVEAKDVNAFVPAGWILEEKITGDLNGDAVPDVIIKLIEAGWDKDTRPENTESEGARALLILLGTSAGKLRRFAFTDQLLQCGSCGGAFYGVMKASASLSIEKGVLIVQQDHGSRHLSNWIFRFRYDASLRQMMLIGLDVNTADRATGETRNVSENLLTRRRLVEVSQYNQKKDRDVLVSRKQQPATLKSVRLEKVDYQMLQEKFEQ